MTVRHLLAAGTCLLLGLVSGCGSSSGPVPPPANPGCVTTADFGAAEDWSPDELWHPVNMRDDASVTISTSVPRDGDGSLMFASTVVTNSQDKADLQTLWPDATYPNRSVANLTALQYDFYRDSSSTIPQHFSPVFRLVIYNPSDSSTALLIWEQAYNGYGAGVPEDTWIQEDILAGNFWMYVTGTGAIQDYDVTLADWLAGNVTPQPGDPTPVTVDANTLVVGINIGIGSWWSTSPGATFTGYVDNVQAAWTDDVLTANFEDTCP